MAITLGSDQQSKISPLNSSVLYFTADTDTNNTDIDLRFSLNEYKNN